MSAAGTAAAVEAAAEALYRLAQPGSSSQIGWAGMIPEWQDIYRTEARAALEAAAHQTITERIAMGELSSSARKVVLEFTSKHEDEDKEITVTSIEDLEAISVKYGHPLVLTLGADGKLTSIEVYDGWRE